jgi:phytol kinase
VTSPAAATGTSVAALPLGRELARKGLHLSSAVLPVGWGLGILSPELLRSLLTTALTVAILVEGARHLSRRGARLFDALFAGLLRPHERGDLTGATWLLAAMLGALLLFPPRAAVVALWAVAAGDGAASIVGRLVRRASSTKPGKTIAGSVTLLLVTALGCAWLADARWSTALLVGLVAAVAEWPRGPLDDNLRVAAAAGIAAWALGLT